MSGLSRYSGWAAFFNAGIEALHIDEEDDLFFVGAFLAHLLLFRLRI